jgi:hypothetical protein
MAFGMNNVQVMRSAWVLFLLLGLNSFGLDASERVFIWNEANAQMQNARTPPEYLRAALIYQRLIDDGVRNGPLFYNIGTALLLADRSELAADAFERAERYLGRQADNDQNLKIAFAKNTKSRTVFLPWYRLAAFWHFYLSCPQRTYIASGAFLVFWLALALKYALAMKLSEAHTLRRMGVKRMINTVAMFSLAVFVVFASSVAASWQMENSAKRYNFNFGSVPSTTNSIFGAGQYSSTNN